MSVQAVHRPSRAVLSLAIRAALIGLSMTALPTQANSASPASAVQTIGHYHIAAGPLNQALEQFSRIAAQAVAYDAEALGTLQTSGVHGHLSAEAALQQLLAGTGLSFQSSPAGYVITPPPAQQHTQVTPPPAHLLLPSVTVLGTAMELDVLRYPGSVSVLDSTAMDGNGTVTEALGKVPGVELGADFGRSIGQRFSVRGFGAESDNRVIVQQDGVRRSTALYANQVSSFRSDADLLKRVEVVKGASAVSHGGGAIGGVVGMTTKDAADFLPSGKDHGVMTKFSYQDNNFREAFVAGALTPEDQPYELLAYVKRGRYGDYSLSRKVDRGNGVISDKVDNQEDLEVVFLKGALNLDHGQRLTLSYYDFSEDVEVTWNTMNALAYASTTGPVVGTLSQRDVVATYTLQPGSPWIDFSATAYHAKAAYDRGYDYLRTDGSPYKLDYENADSRTGLRMSNVMRFEALGARHRLLVGFDYEKREEDASYVLNGVVTEFASMPNTYKDFGLYVQEEASFLDDRLVVHLGGRYDRFSREVDGNDSRYKSNHFSPRAGASFEVVQGVHLLGNYSESFRAPTPHETSSSGPLNIHYYYQPNADLRPETVKEYEVGGSFERRNWFSEGDRAHFKAMYFDGKIDDMINLEVIYDGPPPPESNYYARYENVAQVKRRGFEITGGYNTRRAGVDFSYEHLKQRDAETGEYTPAAFADKLRVGVHYRPLSTVKVQMDVSHWFKPDQNPESYVSAGTRYWYVRDDFTQVNLSTRWTPNVPASWFGRDLELVFGVNNLLDKPYINARNVETTSRVGKGRNVYLSLSSRF